MKIYRSFQFFICLLLALNLNASHPSGTLEPVMDVQFQSCSQIKAQHVAEVGLNENKILSFINWVKEKVKKKLYNWLGLSQAKNGGNSTLFWSWVISLSLGLLLLIIAYSTSGLATLFYGIVLGILGWIFSLLGLILLLIWAVSSAA